MSDRVIFMIRRLCVDSRSDSGHGDKAAYQGMRPTMIFHPPLLNTYAHNKPNARAPWLCKPTSTSILSTNCCNHESASSADGQREYPRRSPPRHSAPGVGSPTNLENSRVLQLFFFFGYRESSDSAPVFPSRAQEVHCHTMQLMTWT
jgi:hypothetical protein